MKGKIFILITAVFVISAGCKQEVITETKINNKKQVAVNTENKKGTLLFFMNPYGMPCQVQDKILNSISSEISEKLNVRYVKTTDPNDRSSFYEYTIRGLPSLVIVDNNYSETKRFTPGIIQKDEILNVVKEL